jgi:hypothetical protein
MAQRGICGGWPVGPQQRQLQDRMCSEPNPLRFDIPMQVGETWANPFPGGDVPSAAIRRRPMSAAVWSAAVVSFRTIVKTGKEMQLVFHKPVRCVDWCSGVSHIRSADFDGVVAASYIYSEGLGDTSPTHEPRVRPDAVRNQGLVPRPTAWSLPAGCQRRVCSSSIARHMPQRGAKLP